jgi:cytochrome c2
MVQIYRYVYVLAFLFLISAASYAQDASVNGPAVFVESRCYTCHTIKAQSAEIGAAKAAFAESKGVELKENEDEKEKSKGGDLSDIGNDRDQKWLSDYVKNPKKYFKSESKCKKLAKKKYRKRFKGSDKEYEVLITYLTTLKYGDMKEAGFESCLIEE